MHTDSRASGDTIEAPTEVAVSITEGAGGQLSYREARQSPCMTCTASPCCTHLALARMTLETLTDVDYVTYLLNFEGIVAGLESDARVQVYLHQPCGYLDVPSGLCTVHGTPTQPAVCSHYNAHSCGYRHRMTAEVHSQSPLVDRRRFAWYVEQLSFDDGRQVVGVPDWDEVLAAFRSMPLERHAAPPPPADPIVEEWKAITLGKRATNGHEPTRRRQSDPAVSDPCQGCGAWCCTTLTIVQGEPRTASQIDHFRYTLGFPAVELGVTDEGWVVIVHTTCRHLDGNRCSVFGTDERPLKCSYYDALKCDYRIDFGTPRPDGMVRVSRDQFDVLAEMIAFDELGGILALPPVEAVRDQLEHAERVRAGVASP